MSTIKMLYEQVQLNHMTFHEGPNGYREPLCRLCMEGTTESKAQILSRWQREVRAQRVEKGFTEEEKAMAVYDHVRADELNSTEEQEAYEA